MQFFMVGVGSEFLNIINMYLNVKPVDTHLLRRGWQECDPSLSLCSVSTAGFCLIPRSGWRDPIPPMWHSGPAAIIYGRPRW